jgi:uncharacterized protein (TIGR03437 family)
MKLKSYLFIALLCLFSGLIFRSANSRAAHSRAAQSPPKALVFSKTSGFRHDSIPDGVALIRQLGQQNGFEVDATEDASIFNDDALAGYRAVIFLSTTGEVLNGEQQAAFERFIRKGRGYVGVHSATDTEYDWPWYGGLVGAYFQNHPNIQAAKIKVEDTSHPSTMTLPAEWQRTDEWYNFRINPRGRVKVLATLDETTYSGGAMGADHPISWCQLYDGGRSWYTAGGHTGQSYSEPLFVQHLLGGIQFAAQIKDGACSALTGTSAASFKPNTLAGEAIGSLFGSQLSLSTEAATVTPLPTTMAGVSLKFKDAAGVERLAPLFYASPTQINFLAPGGMIIGPGVFTLLKSDGAAPSGTIQISPVAPGLFAANANGQGVAAGVALRVRTDGSRDFEPIAQFDQAQNKFIASPIDLGPPTDEVFLVLFGTGIRFLSSQAAATIKLGGSDLPVLFSGSQGTFAGLDQVNVKLARELIGRGEVAVEMNVDGQAANIVSISIR